MIEKLKNYLISTALQKYLPMAGMAAVTALAGLMAAHAGMLEQYGITFGNWPFSWAPGQDPSGPCILIELDTLTKGAIVAIVGLVTVIMRATEHHVATVVVSPDSPPPAGKV